MISVITSASSTMAVDQRTSLGVVKTLVDVLNGNAFRSTHETFKKHTTPTDAVVATTKLGAETLAGTGYTPEKDALSDARAQNAFLQSTSSLGKDLGLGQHLGGRIHETAAETKKSINKFA